MTKKSSGCITIVGVVIGIGGLLLLVLSIIGMFVTEAEMDHNRELYAQSSEAVDCYYNDPEMSARYEEILEDMDAATAAGDSLRLVALQDSLEYYSPPSMQGNIGFNIAGAFLMIPALVGLLMAAIGVLLLVIGIAGGRKKKIDKV